jgi:hypothetical protein
VRNVLSFSLLVPVLWGAGVSGAQTTKTGPDLPQFSLAVSTANNLVKAGSSVVIEVALTNVSDQTIGLPAQTGRDESQWYKVDVRHQNGSMASAVQHRPAGNVVPPGAVKVDVYSAVMVELKPRETSKEKVAISDLFDMSRPGKYSVQVTFRGAKSNTITITVGP